MKANTIISNSLHTLLAVSQVHTLSQSIYLKHYTHCFTLVSFGGTGCGIINVGGEVPENSNKKVNYKHNIYFTTFVLWNVLMLRNRPC